MDAFPDLPRRSGRGARTNPVGRFKRLHVDLDPEALRDDELHRVDTEFFESPAREILSRNESPDIPFTYSLNPYRGCEHGCIYCYARPSHEYLGLSAGVDFETRIFVKTNAAALLSKAFQRPSWVPQVVSLSGNTDPYQPAERAFKLSRQCLEVFLRHRNPVSIITKNGLVRRDLDLLRDLAERHLVQVTLSVTSLDDDIAGTMEPRTARPALRLKTIEALSEAGIPVGVLAAPLVPGLTVEELPSILREAALRGATTAGYQLLRLPPPVDALFIDWLESHFPHRKEKVLARVRSVHDGALNDRQFGRRHAGRGLWAKTTRDLYKLACRKHGLDRSRSTLDVSQFRRLQGGQQELF